MEKQIATFKDYAIFLADKTSLLEIAQNDKCPVNITPNEISKNIQEYFSDLFYQQNNETLSK